MGNFIYFYIVIVISFFAAVVYLESDRRKREKVFELECLKQAKKRDKAKLIIQKEVAEIFRNVCKEVI